MSAAFVLMSKRIKKGEYLDVQNELHREYQKILVIGMDNVTSGQLQKVRMELRNEAVIRMGKNKLIKLAIKKLVDDIPSLEKISKHIFGNVGLVFVKNDFQKVRKVISENELAAPAKAGCISQRDIWIRAGNTGMGPEKTMFFQTIGIPTKIQKGFIEITKDILLVKEGDVVNQTAAHLMAMMGMVPFVHVIKILAVYDNGVVYSPEILAVSDECLLEHYRSALGNISAISVVVKLKNLSSVYPTWLSGFRNIVSLSHSVGYKTSISETFSKDKGGTPGLSNEAKESTESTSKSAQTAAEPAVEEEEDLIGDFF